MTPLIGTLLGSCYFPAIYVLPFYLWGALPRSHPKTIWRRMATSIVFTCSAAWVPTWLSLQPAQAEQGLIKLLGMRATGGTGLAVTAMLPLALTAALFAGPLYMLFLDWRQHGVSPASRVPTGPAALRNLLVAPITEELTFRSCLVSFLLARGVGATACIFLSPLAFGAAHLHHLHDLVRFQGWPLPRACLAVVFQLAYTTVFGWYAAFLLLRTGSLGAVVLVHSFCNFMGFPNFGAVPRHAHPYRMLLVFVAGLAAFTKLLLPLTDPVLYGWPPGQQYVDVFAA